MQELLPIVIRLSKKYTKNESTSISYENAQRIMEGIAYCMKEYEGEGENKIVSDISIEKQYQIGFELVQDKVKASLQLYNDISYYFNAYEVRCLYDTVQKGMPEFFKWYDSTFFPQDTILTLDYPILKDIHEFSGIDAIYEYLKAIQCEQLFFQKLDQKYIIAVLEITNSDYQLMIDNVCHIVLLNMIGHFGTGTNPYNVGLTSTECEQFMEKFEKKTHEEIVFFIDKFLEKIIDEIFGENQDMYEYFLCDIENMASRIENAVKNRQLDKIFGRTRNVMV